MRYIFRCALFILLAFTGSNLDAISNKRRLMAAAALSTGVILYGLLHPKVQTRIAGSNSCLAEPTLRALGKCGALPKDVFPLIEVTAKNNRPKNTHAIIDSIGLPRVVECCLRDYPNMAIKSCLDWKKPRQHTEHVFDFLQKQPFITAILNNSSFYEFDHRYSEALFEAFSSKYGPNIQAVRLLAQTDYVAHIPHNFNLLETYTFLYPMIIDRYDPYNDQHYQKLKYRHCRGFPRRPLLFWALEMRQCHIDATKYCNQYWELDLESSYEQHDIMSLQRFAKIREILLQHKAKLDSMMQCDIDVIVYCKQYWESDLKSLYKQHEAMSLQWFTEIKEVLLEYKALVSTKEEQQKKIEDMDTVIELMGGIPSYVNLDNIHRMLVPREGIESNMKCIIENAPLFPAYNQRVFCHILLSREVPKDLILSIYQYIPRAIIPEYITSLQHFYHPSAGYTRLYTDYTEPLRKKDPITIYDPISHRSLLCDINSEDQEEQQRGYFAMSVNNAFKSSMIDQEMHNDHPHRMTLKPCSWDQFKEQFYHLIKILTQ